MLSKENFPSLAHLYEHIIVVQFYHARIILPCCECSNITKCIESISGHIMKRIFSFINYFACCYMPCHAWIAWMDYISNWHQRINHTISRIRSILRLLDVFASSSRSLIWQDSFKIWIFMLCRCGLGRFIWKIF